MLNLLRPHWLSIAVSVFLLAVATALALLQPLLAGALVNQAAAGSSVLAAATALGAMLVGQLLLGALGHFQLDRIGERIVLRLRAVFTEHVVGLPIGLLDQYRTGDLLIRGTSDAGLLRELPRAVADIAFGALTLVGASIFMLTIDPIAVGVVVALTGVAFAVNGPLLSQIQRAAFTRQGALSDYTAALERALGAARTVKLFGAEEREVESISAHARAAYQAGVRMALFVAIGNPIVSLGITGSFLAIMIIDGSRVAEGRLEVGQFVSLFAFAMYAVNPVIVGFLALTALRTSAGAYQHLHTTLRELPERDPPPRAAMGAVHTCAAPLVEFDHVSFAYGADPVLRDVSFTLGHDQMTALIGPSGAGKSTILALVCRFHEPTAGTVRWAGQDVRSIPHTELRGRLGLLEQEAPVLHGSIRDNLLIADPDARDADLWLVLQQANIADEIAALPHGLDTAVLEHGRSLSGGQRQRLALARALLSRSQLILMDEPTSHLDRTNEYDVMTNLLAARGQRSLLVVAHRLSTVTHADQILVLHGGRIQATGTHAELLRVPVYRELIEHELAVGVPSACRTGERIGSEPNRSTGMDKENE